jgi:membrane protein implicated in regulation of membrane protease activity
VFLTGLAVWALTATSVGGHDFALTTPHGLWATLLYYALLATLALAASVPLREAATTRPDSPPPLRARSLGTPTLA